LARAVWLSFIAVTVVTIVVATAPWPWGLGGVLASLKDGVPIPFAAAARRLFDSGGAKQPTVEDGGINPAPAVAAAGSLQAGGTGGASAISRRQRHQQLMALEILYCWNCPGPPGAFKRP
jgi:hypothetical protein